MHAVKYRDSAVSCAKNG